MCVPMRVLVVRYVGSPDDAVRAVAVAKPGACCGRLAGTNARGLLLRGQRRLALGAASQGPVPVYRDAGTAVQQ